MRVFSRANQSRATLHLDCKRTVFINRAETVVLTECGKNRFDAFEFLLVFRIVAGQNFRRFAPCVASGPDDPAYARPRDRDALCEEALANVSESPRGSVDVVLGRRRMKQREDCVIDGL